jgi:hypothetical protein
MEARHDAAAGRSGEAGYREHLVDLDQIFDAERQMKIKISSEESQVAGFISWERLAKTTFHGSAELHPRERITYFEISERGINYFVTTLGAKP